MNKFIRVLMLLSPIIIVGFAFYEHGRWQPPLNPDVPQPVEIEVLLEHPEAYGAPIELIIHGTVYNKSDIDEYIFLYGPNDSHFKLNCTSINISAVEPEMYVYIRGYYYSEEQYLLVIELHIHTSYSLYLSIPGAFLVLIILFWGFKFNLDDFSFSRKVQEEQTDA